MEQPARPLAQPRSGPLDQLAIRRDRFNVALLVCLLLCLAFWLSVALAVRWLM
jgi:hypothetical protein